MSGVGFEWSVLTGMLRLPRWLRCFCPKGHFIFCGRKGSSRETDFTPICVCAKSMEPYTRQVWKELWGQHRLFTFVPRSPKKSPVWPTTVTKTGEWRRRQQCCASPNPRRYRAALHSIRPELSKIEAQSRCVFTSNQGKEMFS